MDSIKKNPVTISPIPFLLLSLWENFLAGELFYTQQFLDYFISSMKWRFPQNARIDDADTNKAKKEYLHSHFHHDRDKNLAEPISHWAGLQPNKYALKKKCWRRNGTRNMIGDFKKVTYIWFGGPNFLQFCNQMHSST